MAQSLISGFMVVKNTAVQGYPFVEAIRSALPICDEFLVSDGHSTDDTWRALEVLRDAHPGRVKLFRDPWPVGANRGGAIAKMTNVLRWRCSGRYILNLQANEVFHEASLEEARNLITRWPSVPLFRLPFHNLLGERLLWMTDHRRRLGLNRPDIVSVSDAFDMGFERSPIQRVLGVLNRVPVYAHNAWLKQPVYRYRVLFPIDYVRRLEEATDSSHLWLKELRYAKSVLAQMDPSRDEPVEFWRRMREYFDRVMFEDLPRGVAVESSIPRRCVGEIADAPAIMRPLFGAWRYPLDESLRR